MRIGDRDFPIDPRALESGSISWAGGVATAGCPLRAVRRVEELDAAATLQAALAEAGESAARWCGATTGTTEDAGREIFYVLSRVPDGASSLAAFLEAESNAPAGLTETRRAGIAWSVGVGTLRALADIHERGIHHGELSPESAMRDRIVVRPRPDGTLDVMLQFPSPRLARLLQEERQSEVASPDQTDIVRLAHVLRAVLHGRDALDPDTSIDEMLLSRLFGENAAAWKSFFDGCARGALHGDPAFVRAQLALLSPAKPAEGGSAAARDLKFRLGRTFAQPVVRFGSIGAGIAVVGIVAVTTMWSRIFPPVRWNVSVVGPESADSQDARLKELGAMRVRVARESAGEGAAKEGDSQDPTEVIGLCYREGDAEPFARLEFDSQGEREWRADPLPDSDRPYEVRFKQAGFVVTNGAVKVEAEDAKPTYLIDDKSRISDDDGVVRLLVSGVDVDSGAIVDPVVSIEGRAATLRLADEQPAPGDDAGPLASTRAWIAEVDLSDLQTPTGDVRVYIKVGETVLGREKRAQVRSIPFELKRDQAADANPEEGARITLQLQPKRNRTIGTRERSAVIQFSRDGLAERTVKFDGGKATIELPQADGEYTVTVAVAGLKDVNLEIPVSADDDPSAFTLTVGEPQPPESPRSATVRVPVRIRAEDVDTETGALARPRLFDGDSQLALRDVREEAASPRDGVRGARAWSGFVELVRADADRRATLTLRSDGAAGTQLATASEVRVVALPKPEPVTIAKAETKSDGVGPTTVGSTKETAAEPTTRPAIATKEGATETATGTVTAATGDQPKTDTTTGPKDEPTTLKEPEPVVEVVPPPRPGPPLARVSSPKTDENQSVTISVYAENPELPLDGAALGAVSWRLIDAPPPLRSSIVSQLDVINRDPERDGSIRAPEYNAPYRMTLELKSSDPAFPEPSRVVIDVGAKDDGSVEDRVVNSKGQALRPKSDSDAAENEVSDGVVRIEVRVVDPDSTIDVPPVVVNGEPWSDFGERADATSRPAGEKVFVGDIRIAGGARSEIMVNGKTYVVRWDPSSPSDAGITWVAFSELPDGSWLSAPIGFAAGEFSGATEAQALSGAQLAQLLERFNGSGFDARLADVDVVSAAMKARPDAPSLDAIVHSLVGASSVRTLRTNSNNPSVAWMNAALRDAVPNWGAVPVTLDRDVDRAFRATYCGDVANPQIVGLPVKSLDISGRDSKKNVALLRAAFDALWSGGMWNPRLFPSETPVKVAYARVVLVKKKAP
jgi:hypothetical protein